MLPSENFIKSTICSLRTHASKRKFHQKHHLQPAHSCFQAKISSKAPFAACALMLPSKNLIKSTICSLSTHASKQNFNQKHHLQPAHSCFQAKISSKAPFAACALMLPSENFIKSTICSLRTHASKRKFHQKHHLQPAHSCFQAKISSKAPFAACALMLPS